jgi:hypothetical protein
LKGEFMNELNYASLEASKKLVENGIMLETDAVWVKWYFDGSILSDRNPYEWRLQYKALTQTDFESIPAPCFTEVWRELPESITKGGTIQYLEMGKTGSKTYAAYDFADEYVLFDNPTDALAELLIWVKGQEEV